MKQRLERKVQDIVTYLMDAKSEDEGYSLFSGAAGVSLFLFYYSRYSNNDKYSERAMEILASAIDKIDSNLNYTYCEGISGLCWCIDHLVSNGFIDRENDEVLSHFDTFIGESSLTALSYQNNDFLHGAIGSAFYLLKRTDQPGVKRMLKQLVEILYEHKIPHNEQIYWKYKIGFVKDSCNISLAHGMASTCIFLTKAAKLDISRVYCDELLSKSIDFLLKQEIERPNRISIYPTYSNLLQENSNLDYKSRLGWCYGDLGIALSIWQYSNYIDNISLKNKAIEIFLFSCQRTELDMNSVIDAGLCHGTAGIALIFKRMYLNTNLSEFQEAANYWLDQTLLMDKYHDGIMGYKANCKESSIGFLDGVAGIGLVLLSFLSNDDPKWDECLLLS